ncbi:hypothetical protein [Streptomyces sp. NRRL B-24085]|nr:hypothetical protein [Streptomyces sp. NRRL B-24085]
MRTRISRVRTELDVHDRAAADLRARDAGHGSHPDTALPRPA